MTEAASASGPTRSSAVRIIGLIAAIIALAVVARFAGAEVPRFAAWVNQLGFWGPVVFILGYAAAVVALVPGLILTLAGGAIFGVGFGFLYVFCAAVLGSGLAFLVSRYIARAAIEQRIAGNARFAAVDRAVGREGLKIVFLLRLCPLFPFSLLNYALGLTRVRFGDYMLAAIGMVPGTLLYVYYGKLAGDVAAIAGGAHVEKGWADYALLAFGVVALAIVVTIITRIARRALGDLAADSPKST